MTNQKICLTLCLFLSFPSIVIAQTYLKSPNVSGSFYDADAKVLSLQIDQLINQAVSPAVLQNIEILISPHAGYYFSGAVAGYGFKAAQDKQYSTVVILAPSHFFGFNGISVWPQGAFQTPLGNVKVDQQMSERLMDANDQFYFEPKAFEREHSLEVQLPFIQKTFPDAKIVPVVFGQTPFKLLEDFSRALNQTIGDREDVLIVVSTDFSHYHPDEKARQLDQQAIEAIKNLQAQRIYVDCGKRVIEMCGFIPVTAAVLYANLKGYNQVDVLKYANSGDVTDDKSKVVGYASILISKGAVSIKEQSGDSVSSNELSSSQQSMLLEIAKQTIQQYLSTGEIYQPVNHDPRLNEKEGAFVSIYNKKQLRGCIGHIIGSQPLYLTVRDMAISSATEDGRFAPVNFSEINDLSFEISVLSVPRVGTVDEIQLGKHGVIVTQFPRNRGIFLPQVADSTGWSKQEFLSQLCNQKAGLPRDCWKDPKTQIEVFTAQVF